MSSHDFFFYGSLMDRDLLSAVLGHNLAPLKIEPAWFDDHVAETALGYSFPTLTPSKGACTQGQLVQGLTDGDVDRISYFEDTEYQPIEVTCRTTKRPRSARSYFATTSLRSSGEPWDFAHWRLHHKPLLLAVTRKVMSEHYGRTPLTEIDAVWHRIKSELEGR